MRRPEIRGSNGGMDLVLRPFLKRAGCVSSRTEGARISKETATTKGLTSGSVRTCTNSKILLQVWPEQVFGVEREAFVLLAEACLQDAQ